MHSIETPSTKNKDDKEVCNNRARARDTPAEKVILSKQAHMLSKLIC